jgi:hypothetical protein
MNKVAHFQVAAGRIDRKRGTIYGVAVITAGEAKGHGLRVDMTTLEQVMDCAKNYIGGLAVRFAEEDHGGGAANIVGNLRNWSMDGEVLRADLRLLKAHPDYELVLEMSETMPEAFGLSIVFSGQHERNEAGVFARCTELYGCDVVKNPAANPTGLFSAPVDTQEPSSMKNDQAKNLEVELSQTSAALKDAEAKLAEQTAQLTALVAERDGAKAKADELTAADARNLDALQAAATEINAFKTQVAELQAKLDATEKSVSQRVADEIAKLGVPPIDGKPVNPEPTAEQLRGEYETLSKTNFAKARDFWKKHEAKLSTPQMLAWKKQNGLY